MTPTLPCSLFQRCSRVSRINKSFKFNRWPFSGFFPFSLFESETCIGNRQSILIFWRVRRTSSSILMWMNCCWNIDYCRSLYCCTEWITYLFQTFRYICTNAEGKKKKKHWENFLLSLEFRVPLFHCLNNLHDMRSRGNKKKLNE